jgi:hypothetical protein
MTKRKAATMQTAIEQQECQADYCESVMHKSGLLPPGRYFLKRRLSVPQGATIHNCVFVGDHVPDMTEQVSEARRKQDEIERLRELGVVFQGDIEG